MSTGSRMAADDVRRWMNVYLHPSGVPDFDTYASGVAQHLERFLWFVGYMMRLGNVFDCRVLDIGCGFGWYAVAISLLGRNAVVANDIRPQMTACVKERVSALRTSGCPVAVEPLTGDICDAALPDESFDAIVSNQTIEHVRDLDAMFKQCIRMLKRGGRLILADDNNVLSRAARAEAAEMWEMRDRSWDYVEALKRERPIENAGIKPYAALREEIVARANPRLDAVARAHIVQATAGLLKADIERFAREYSASAKLPVRPRFSWCRNPLTGEYCERLLHPYEIARSLERLGFRARVLHAFRRLPLRILNDVRIPGLNELLFNVRPIFLVCAIKA